jgi:hypothetical protein
VKNYILNQKQHHNIKTFEEEYVSLLEAYEIEYNKDYFLKD